MSLRHLLPALSLIAFATVAAPASETGPYPALEDSLMNEFPPLSGTVERVADVPSLEELHGWITRRERRLMTAHAPGGLVPVGIYRSWGRNARPARSIWNVSVGYGLPLKTYDAEVTFMAIPVSDDAVFRLRAIYGSGSSVVDDIGSVVDMKLGIGAEMGWSTESRWFNPMVGLVYAFVDPEIGADGDGIDITVGDRIYLNRTRDLSFDLRAGRSLWGGFDGLSPSNWSFSGAMTLHRRLDLRPAGDPLLAPLELGVHMNTLKYNAAKLSVPVRAFRGVQIVPVLEFGQGVVVQQRALGFEARLFGDEKALLPRLEPYVGYHHLWMDYEGVGDDGSGSTVRFGARGYLNDRLAVDASVGPMFWSDGYPVSKPHHWSLSAGVSVAFGTVDLPKRLSGAVWVTDAVEPGAIVDDGPLTSGRLADDDGEVRVFARRICTSSTDTVVVTRTDTVTVYEDPKTYAASSLGDLTDLRYFSVTLDLDIGFTPFNDKAELISAGESSERDVVIAVLFPRDNPSNALLDQGNAYLQFLDLDHGQFYGYRWDANRKRQPEYRDHLELGVVPESGGQRYWGGFDEFVRPLEWLSGEQVFGFVEGGAVERRLLDLMETHFAANDTVYADAPTLDVVRAMTDRYRVGFVRFPERTIDRVRANVGPGSFGVAVMLGQDNDRDGDLFVRAAEINDARWSGGVPPDHLEPSSKVVFDAGDDFVLSNPVRVEHIIAEDLSLVGFDECSAELTPDHVLYLRSRVLPRLLVDPDLAVGLKGYTDATPLSPECGALWSGQEALALARAEKVQAWLVDHGVAPERIRVDGRGVRLQSRFRWGADRAVDIEFVD